MLISFTLNVRFEIGQNAKPAFTSVSIAILIPTPNWPTMENNKTFNNSLKNLSFRKNENRHQIDWLN